MAELLNWETKFLREIYNIQQENTCGRPHQTFERKDKQMFYGDKFLQNSAQAQQCTFVPNFREENKDISKTPLSFDPLLPRPLLPPLFSANLLVFHASSSSSSSSSVGSREGGGIEGGRTDGGLGRIPSPPMKGTFFIFGVSEGVSGVLVHTQGRVEEAEGYIGGGKERGR